MEPEFGFPPARPASWRRTATALAWVLTVLACDTAAPPHRTSDTTPPVVVQTAPVAGAVGVDTTAAVTVVFSEAMNAATVRPGATFRLAVEAVDVPGMVVGDAEERRFIFVPERTLPGERWIAVEVRAVADAAGNWLEEPFAFSFRTAGTTPNRPPEAPCNPVPAAGATSVPDTTRLAWACGGDPDGDEVAFEVYLGTTASPPLVATIPAPPYYPLAPLAEDTRFYWRIIADDGRGGRTAGPLWSFVTALAPNAPPTPPAPPTNPASGATIDSLAVTLTWSGGEDPDLDPVTFEVRFGTANPPPVVGNTSVRAWRVANLELDTRYNWQIVASDGRGHSVPGPLWHFWTAAAPNAPPSAPASPNPPDEAIGVRTDTGLAWSGGDDPDLDPVVYIVYFERDDASDPDSVATVFEKFYAPPRLEEGADYYWQIEAQDDRGAATAGPIWHFTTNHPPDPPCNPDPAAGETGVEIIVLLRWDCGRDPEDLPVSYDIYFGTTPDPTGPIATVDRRSYLVGGVLPWTTYTWRIVARDPAGGETTSPVWSFTTGGLASGEPRPRSRPR